MKAIVTRIAPPCFLLFFAMLAAAIAATTHRAVVAIGDDRLRPFGRGLRRRLIELYNDPPMKMREAAKENDAHRSILLFPSRRGR